jgi:hypothetical protein
VRYDVIYVKSIFAGLAAVIVTSIILLIWVSATREGQFGIDVISLIKSPIAWIYVFVLFGLGFGWELRRLAK